MLIALSFCAKDQEAAERLAQWCAELGCGKGHHLLIGVDVDTTNAQTVVETFLKSFDKVDVLSIKNPYTEWAQAPNHAFQEIARYIEEKQLAKYFLWLEPDVVPLTADCFTALETEHLKGGKAFTGAFVKGFNGGPDHMSGVGLYPGNITHHAGPTLLATTTPFDIAAADMVIPRAHFTDLVFHRWKGIRFETLQDLRDMIGPAPVIYHSCKDSTLIDLLREEKKVASSNLADVAGASETATVRPHDGLSPSSSILPDISETDRTLKRFTEQEPVMQPLKPIMQSSSGKFEAGHVIVPWRDKAESIAEIKRTCAYLRTFCKAPRLTQIVRRELKEAGVIKKVR